MASNLNRGLWVWNSASILSSSAQIGTLIGGAQTHGISDLYFYMAPSYYQQETDALQDFISGATAVGVRVWALDGDRAYLDDAAGPAQFYHGITTSSTNSHPTPPLLDSFFPLPSFPLLLFLSLKPRPSHFYVSLSTLSLEEHWRSLPLATGSHHVGSAVHRKHHKRAQSRLDHRTHTPRPPLNLPRPCITQPTSTAFFIHHHHTTAQPTLPLCYRLPTTSEPAPPLP